MHSLADKYKLKNKNTNTELNFWHDSPSLTEDLSPFDSPLINPIEESPDNNITVNYIIQKTKSSLQINDLGSNYVAESMSKLTISQKSRKQPSTKGEDLFRDDSSKDLSTLEENFEYNENNNFIDSTSISSKLCFNTNVSSNREVDNHSQGSQSTSRENHFSNELQEIENVIYNSEDMANVDDNMSFLHEESNYHTTSEEERSESSPLTNF